MSNECKCKWWYQLDENVTETIPSVDGAQWSCLPLLVDVWWGESKLESSKRTRVQWAMTGACHLNCVQEWNEAAEAVAATGCPNEWPCATMPSQCPSNCVVTSPLVGQLRRKQVKANCFLSIALLDCSFLPVSRQMCYGQGDTPGNPLYFGNVLHSLAPVRQLFSGCRDDWRCSLHWVESYNAERALMTNGTTAYMPLRQTS